MTPRAWGRVALVVQLVALLLCIPGARAGWAQEKPTDAPTFRGGYMWRQLVVQGVQGSHGIYEAERGDFWGGRLVAGLGLGRFGAELRLDVAGLKDQFNPQDPTTFKTLEAYAALHFVAAARGGLQVGPALVVGSITSFDVDEGQPAWSGVGVDLAGCGVRLGGFGSEVFLLVARTRYLALDPATRLVFAAHVRLTDQLYAVGDAVSGQDGFVRVGIAVRAF